MSLLTGRYSGNPETAFDEDVRQIDARGLEKYIHSTIQGELSESFWTTLLPQRMETSSVSSPYFSVYQAAQVKLNDKGFLSRDITVQDLLLIQCDVHHVYPRSYLKKLGFSRARYNQIANFVLAQSEINIAIGNKKPEVYFKELAEQCSGGKRKYGSIQNRGDMESNLKSHCIPVKFLEGEIPEYEEFLEERRKLMAAKIRDYFQSLSIHTAEA